MEIALIYVFLLSFMMFSLYVSGKEIARCERKKKKYGFLCYLGIIVFTLNEGLRFGRGIDYNLYYGVYNDIIYHNDKSFELLFTWLVKLFGLLHLPWQAFVMFMSFMFVYSIYRVARQFTPSVSFVFAFVPLFTMFAENIMRQTLGLSFFLIGFSFLLENHKWKNVFYLVFSLFGGLCHTSIFLLVPIFFIVTLLKKEFFSPFISIPVFVFSTIFFQSSFMLRFYNIIQIFMVTDRFSAYGNDMESLLMGDADVAEITISYSVTAVYFICVILGYKLRHYFGQQYTVVYNLFLIGFLSYPLFNKIELFSRFSMMFQMFAFVILGSVAYFLFVCKKRVYRYRSYLCCLFVIVFANYFRTFVIPPFKHPYTFQYVWDKGGKQVLDVMVYKEELEKK